MQRISKQRVSIQQVSKHKRFRQINIVDLPVKVNCVMITETMRDPSHMFVVCICSLRVCEEPGMQQGQRDRISKRRDEYVIGCNRDGSPEPSERG